MVGDVSECDELLDGELFRSGFGVDVGWEREGFGEDGSELFAAFGEEGLEEGRKLLWFGGEGSGKACELDDGGGDFGLGPEAGGGEVGDACDVVEGLEEDGDRAVVFGVVVGDEAVGDFLLDHDDGEFHGV